MQDIEKTVQDAVRMMLAEPSRYAIRGWSITGYYISWAQRPAGAEAVLLVDDLKYGEVLKFRGVPEKMPLICRSMAGKVFASKGGKAKSAKKTDSGRANIAKARGVRWKDYKKEI